MSFILDSTIGLFVVYIGLKVTQVVVRQKKIETLYFGEYGKYICYTHPSPSVRVSVLDAGF